MTTNVSEYLRTKLEDTEYAKLYGAADAKSEFAIALSLARKKVNITQESLAEKADVSQPYIAKLEGGEANPTLGTVGSILAVMGLRLDMNTKPILVYSEDAIPPIKYEVETDYTGSCSEPQGLPSGDIGEMVLVNSSGSFQFISVNSGMNLLGKYEGYEKIKEGALL